MKSTEAHSGSDVALARNALRREIGSVGFFTLAFGAMVGSGWVVVLGQWLAAAGPGGAVAAFVGAGLLMMLIGACYGELASRSSLAGGEFLYALETFGPRTAFMVAWFIALYAVSLCAFEAIALAWFLQTLFPAITLHPLYRVLGTPVTADALIVGLGGAVLVAQLHCGGVRSAVRFQNVVTFSFLLVNVALVAIGLGRGKPSNLTPWFGAAAGGQWLTGMFWVFGTCGMFMNGFQTALHGIEERNAGLPARTVVHAMLMAIIAAALFYALIILAAASAAPWRWVAEQDLPAVAAFRSLPGGAVLATVMLITAAASLTKCWTAVSLMGSRLVYALARREMLPRPLAVINSRGAPRNAIWFVSGASMLGILAGRGAVSAIVSMCSICMAMSFVLCVSVLLVRRRRGDAAPSFTVPGGIYSITGALIGAVLMAAVAALGPLLGSGRLPVEWLLLGGWGVAGALAWRLTTRRSVSPGLSAAPTAAGGRVGDD